jgi:hypothetical protein
MSTTQQHIAQSPLAETQGQFRARMRAAFGDGRNGTVHWRDNPAAQAAIAERKTLRDQAWNAQLAKWKDERGSKKALRKAADQAKLAMALQAESLPEALAILGLVRTA